METKTLIAEPAAGPYATSAPIAPDEILLEPHSGWRPVNFREILQHRDLLVHMVRRNILSRYVQSVLGLSWTLIQPLTTMIIFSVVFGRVAKIPVPGGVPYALFAFCGIVPWTFFSGALTATSSCLINNTSLLGKVYFPRLILPVSEMATKLFDLVIIFVVLLLLMAGFGYVPRPEAALMIPLATLVAAVAALGMGLWLSVLALQYRDVAYSLMFVIQIMMYLSPVIYGASLIVDAVGPRLAMVWGLNPMVGVISAYRSSLLGMQEPLTLPLLAEGAVVSVILLVTGALYFRRSERLFADVS